MLSVTIDLNFDDVQLLQKGRNAMRILIVAMLVLAGFLSASGSVHAQQSNSCKVCAEQRQACMKNYSGPTCKTEYDRCMKSCKK